MAMRAGVIKPGRNYDFVAQTLLPGPINRSWQVRLPTTAWRFGAGPTTSVSGRAFANGVRSLRILLTDLAEGIKAGTSKPTVVERKNGFPLLLVSCIDDSFSSPSLRIGDQGPRGARGPYASLRRCLLLSKHLPMRRVSLLSGPAVGREQVRFLDWLVSVTLASSLNSNE